MRKSLTDKPPPVEPRLNQRRAGSDTTHLVTQVRRYELITPLFGGGVEPGTADFITVIRGSGIRGHMRFWWRACCGGQFKGDLRAMKRAEDRLWGAASIAGNPSPSQVQIQVEINESGNLVHPYVVVAGKPGKDGKPRPRLQAKETVAPAYAAFPLQPSEAEIRTRGNGMETKGVVEKVRFTLTIIFPQSERGEVEAALWAWETLGGIGARTRRGFGALRNLDASLPPANTVHQFVQNGLQQYVTEGAWPVGVPHLVRSPRMKITAVHPNARLVWEHLIKRLKDFRQKRPGPPNDPGRTVWPEPDAVRRLTGQHLDKGVNGETVRHQPVHSAGNKFPRAVFGLPIIFHFKDMNRSNLIDPTADPRDTTLRGKDHDRFSSPLILRPLACANGQAVGVGLILEGTGIENLPGGLILKGAPGDPTVHAVLEPHEATAIAPLGGNSDVLEAFMKTL